VTPLAAGKYIAVSQVRLSCNTFCKNFLTSIHFLCNSLAIISLHYTLSVTCTDNSIESFNAIVKYSYTLGVRHTHPALYDILEQLILDVSLDLISGRKEWLTIQLPSKEVQLSMKKIDQSTYRVTTLSTASLWYVTNYETEFVTYLLVNELCTLLHKWSSNF
jgi:hypothetical protein